ncbi:type VI secretion system tube protein TssD [Spirosoma sp.]|uniref:type VI secretion system tube protein TssD n=1 Tax=Spirosoma sp. TaxID=1899569 RepID=UPI002616147C|nr:type VI secretion system tube protein TssD [Spirosoma sp.]MCX6216957.1 type VI secretion system tube protein TssD [Spirosoma sp.]
MAQSASAVAAKFWATGFSPVEVQSCSYELHRSVDQKGRPAGITQGGIITVEIAANKDTTPLAEWITDPFKEGDGGLEFFDDRQQSVKRVEFNNARCIGYSERFDKVQNIQTPDLPSMTMKLKMSAEKISIGGALHDNNWSDKQ